MTRPTFGADYDDFERALLGSARADAMAPEKKRALAVALGGGAAAAVMTTASTAAGAAKATHGLASGALLKWLAALAVGSTLAASAGVVAVRAGDDAAPRVMAIAPAPAPLKRATRSVAPAPVAEAPAAMNANDLPAAAAPTTRPAAPTPSITEEIALVARARQALRAGDVAGAASALDAHDRQFPRGALAEESAVLRVETVHATDPARGKKLGRAFLAKHPESPHAARVRALVGGDE